MSPAKGFSGDSHTVLITGQGMYPLVLANASAKGGQIDAGFSVELLQDGQVVEQLRGVRLLDVNQLEAVVPQGLPLGQYDLRVGDPNGRQGELAKAFQVTSSRVEGLGLTVDGADVDQLGAAFRINQPTSFQVYLFDDRGLRVSEQVPLHISVESVDGGAVDGTLDAYLLDGRSFGPGLVVSGSTFGNGTGEFDLTLHSPADVLLRVSSPDQHLGLDDLTIPMSWVAGKIYDVDILLPSANFSTAAGAEFVAQLTLVDRENQVVVTNPELPVDAVLFDACNEIGEDVQLRDLRGTKSVRLAFSGATGTADCPEQRLKVRLDGDLHVSNKFDVLPGKFAGFGVRLQNSVARAGQPHRADAVPSDAFGNPVSWDGDPDLLEVFDSIGDVRTVGCGAGTNFHSCVVTPTDADERVVLTVRDPVSGAQGFSDLYSVKAGPVDRLIVVPSAADLESGVVAGEDLSVTVTLHDEFGNDVDVTEAQANSIVISSTFDDASCELAELGERGQAEFVCTLTTAFAGVELFAKIGGASGVSPRFAVANAELSRVALTFDASEVTAGDAFDVYSAGFDAWDNPYKVHSDPTFTLTSTSEAAPLITVSLDGTGRAETSLSLEQAGTRFLVAKRGPVELGRSSAITVIADAADHLVVTSSDPWSWSGKSSTLSVLAADRFGNPAKSTEDVDVTGAAGTFAGASVALVDGVAAVTVAFDGTALTETVSAVSESGLRGSLPNYAVVADCGSNRPTAVVSFAGSDDAISCHDGMDAGLDASFSGSLAATGRSVARYGLWVEGAGAALSTSRSISATLFDVGAFSVKGLVVDNEHCATELDRTAWVGLDDGAPVGPIDLGLASDSLEAGLDKTGITLTGLTTCDGKAASKAKVFLRSDRGVIIGTTASGSGLQVTLDSAGDGSATLDLTADKMDGVGAVTASVVSGAALGTAEFGVTGDLSRPRVLVQDPAGYAVGDLDVIELLFSERLDPNSVDAAAFTVSGPGAVSVESVLMSDDGTSVEVWLDHAITAEDGRWNVVASATITDDDGNGLDGAWTGSSAVHRAVFGDVSSTTVTVTGCAPGSSTIRPDGDAGSGAEADVVSFAAKASGTPSHWVVDVAQPDGRRAAFFKQKGTSSSAALVWNAKDLSGRIVPDGLYTVRVHAANADDSLSSSCTTTVAVDNTRAR